jgi:S1-C subfamily serine protease
MRRLLVLLLCMVLSWSAPAQRAQTSERRASAEQALSAVVEVRMRALGDARTRPYLGAERRGSGVVIDPEGHILTIGYLVIEAESIEVRTAEGKLMAATLAGYDHDSGLAVLRAVGALGVRPLELGSAEALAERDPVLVLPYGGREAARLAFVVSRREFTGNWEYLLEAPIFTTPPAENWSGSALIDRDGHLVGVGHLFVRDSADTAVPVPGNLFVPVDLLKPVLADLIRHGRRSGPARPWLGMATEEVQGHLLVSRISPEGPADEAGIQAGDIVVAVGRDPVASRAELYRKLWGLGPAGVEVPLRVLHGAELREYRLRSVDRLDYLKRAPAH